MKKTLIALCLILSSLHAQAQTSTGQSIVKNGLQVQYSITTTPPSTTDAEEEDATVRILLKEKDQTLASKTYKQPTYNLTFTQVKIMSGKGLRGVKNIISISHNPDADEIPEDTYFWAWDGQRLITLPSTMAIYVADQGSADSKLIFPADKGGIANTIRKIETSIDPDSKKTHKTEQRFIWRGKDIPSTNQPAE